MGGRGKLDRIKPVGSPLDFMLRLVLLIANKLHTNGADVELFVIPSLRLVFESLFVVGLSSMRPHLVRLLLQRLLRRRQLATIHYPILRFQNFTHLYFLSYSSTSLCLFYYQPNFCSNLFNPSSIINNEF